ncbi:MAG TPA: MEDS domain-containing protein, partial [Thermoanaerobaculia bacterium]|nr:MEDS domain-containing protein [Thermoanaerobaculia bacterium]
FYRTKQDLIEVLVPYFEAGLRNHELCLWVTSEPLLAGEARELMAAALPELAQMEARGQIEIRDFKDWYQGPVRSSQDVLDSWIERERRALAAGYSGLRLTGNTFWLEATGWADFVAYEELVNRAFGRYRILALCTYSLERCGAEDVIDVCHNHQFALVRRQGDWEMIESSSLKVAKEELTRVNEQLKHRVTERTAELETAVRGRDEFLAMLAHELRNPLAPIRTSAELLRQPGASPERALRASDVIGRQVCQLARLVDDLLDVSRVTHGRIELRRQRVDLADVMAQAIEAVRPLIERRGQTLEVVLPPEPVAVQADPARLAQVFGNLLDNAAKYGGEGGSLRFCAERQGDQAVIRAVDHGIGIPPEMLGRIFELFTQTPRTLDRSEGGLGIGLALVRSLVEQHGGSVEAASAGLGKGSTFTIRLPVAEEPQAAAPAPPTALAS